MRKIISWLLCLACLGLDHRLNFGPKPAHHPGRADESMRANAILHGQVSRRSALTRFAIAALVVPRPSVAALNALPDDVSGQWSISETSAGNQCSGTLILEARSSQSPQPSQVVLGTQRGSARYTSSCVDPAAGTWTSQSGKATGPRLASRFDYENSSVFYSFALEQAKDGRLEGNGEIYSAPRSDPNDLRQVGTFKARRVSPAKI
mmetsp:Transcript_98712/g.180564  ORF Transcript_98712/g.180564 Transcript_98712/m.180564 type:complete len:206 (+) Transcript_98712:67-684(+)